jgi:hypothetical protein
MSNCYCHPGRAGGPPLEVRSGIGHHYISIDPRLFATLRAVRALDTSPNAADAVPLRRLVSLQAHQPLIGS